MNIEDLRDYCLSLPGAQENMPWSEREYDMLVTFTVGGKWFCLLDMEAKRMNVKCEPERVTEMQSRYEGAMPAWHMNKVHWLGVLLDSDVPDSVIKSLLSAGYKLIVRRLPKSVRQTLEGELPPIN